MQHAANWERTKEKFIKWWGASEMDRPLMRIISKKSGEGFAPPPERPADPKDYHMDARWLVESMRHFCRTHTFHADAFPSVNLDIGPGSLAVYLGAEPEFAWDTVWYSRCIRDYEAFGPLHYDGENPWWREHCRQLRLAVELARGEFLINIPDLIENIDILAAMRGPQELCYDLMDRPDQVRESILQLEQAYFEYFDRAYDIVKEPGGGCGYSMFYVWAPGPMAKVQCDFSAMLSPVDFKTLVLPSLARQCGRLRYSLYHLDGKDAIRHLDAILEIESLNALQWTAGAGQPDGANERWYTIYDRVRAAGKSVWAEIHDGGATDWAAAADRLMQRYGPTGMYLLFPIMDEGSAETLLSFIDKHW